MTPGEVVAIVVLLVFFLTLGVAIGRFWNRYVVRVRVQRRGKDGLDRWEDVP